MLVRTRRSEVGVKGQGNIPAFSRTLRERHKTTPTLNIADSDMMAMSEIALGLLVGGLALLLYLLYK